MNIYLKIFTYFILYLATMSYYEEYIFARHIFFQTNLVTGKIRSFGKSKIHYNAKAAREFYSIVDYRLGTEMYTAKILRDIEDTIGNSIIIAVNRKNNCAVRYKKCRIYNEHEYEYEYNGKRRGMFCAFVLISLIVIDIWFGGMKEVCLILITLMCIHYLLMPWSIQLRNSIWQLK
ncbi:MAG: hypothetical protein HDR01_00850 [Lachnospiraceae bacterium]|nr:hypothetical protein [Lachnospiraceae bacterium]